MTAPNYIRCFYCGNRAGKTQPLVWDEAGHITHLRGPCGRARDEQGEVVCLVVGG